MTPRMHASSSLVSSTQASIHPRLRDSVLRHLRSPWQIRVRPTIAALAQRLAACERLVLDLGCGTGESTLALAQHHRDCQVVGIDQSAQRLRRYQLQDDCAQSGGALLCRADSFELLHALAELRVRAEKTYLLYPNPWPKPEHLKRRWHAHPAFVALLSVSNALELRSNWPLYVEEFAFALDVAGYAGAKPVAFSPVTALSAFEKKYSASGHPLYALNVQLK